MSKVLILGRLPPPVGGITTHVSRLIENLQKQGFTEFTFANPNEGFWEVFLKWTKHQVLHAHISSPYWQLCIALICSITRKKLILTFHGTWGRYNVFGNLIVALACRITHTPILQNRESFDQAVRFNGNAQLISTYIKSESFQPLEQTLAIRLSAFRKQHETVACTNAWNVTFDRSGQEIYGVSELIEWIKTQKNSGLIISDPSGSYVRFIRRAYKQLSANVLFLSAPHDFRQVLKVADVFIRNTTTDGVSLSICEALDLGIPVLASNSVSRPDNCLIFNHLNNLNLKVAVAEAKRLLPGRECEKCSTKTVGQIISVYRTILSGRKGKKP